MTETSSQKDLQMKPALSGGDDDVDFKFEKISNLIDDEMTIQIRDLNGNRVYIAEISVVVTTPDPILLITVAPF